MEQAIRELLSSGQSYRQKGDYAKAHVVFEQAFTEEPNDLTRLAFAQSLNSFGHHLKAFELAICVRNQTHDNELKAEAINIMAMAIGASGYTAEAIEFSLESLRAYQSVQGDEHEKVALLLNNIGFAYADLRELDKAEDYHQQALLMRRKLQVDKGQLAQSINNLGMVALAGKHYEQAAQTLNEAYQMRADYFGSEHVETAVSINNLGLLAMKQQNYEQAQRHFAQAYAIRSKSYATESQPAVSRSLLYLAFVTGVHLDQTSADALTQAQSVLAYRDKLYATGHPETCQALNLTAQIANRLEQEGLAKRLQQRDKDEKQVSFEQSELSKKLSEGSVSQ